MNRYIIGVLIVFLLMIPLAVNAAESAPPPPQLPDKATVIEMVDYIEAQPLSPLADVARQDVVYYANYSDDVHVIIDTNILPWIKQSEWSDLLLASYIAGNVRSQLQRNKRENDTYAGLTLMILAYNELRKNDPNIRIAEIDKQIQLLKEDKLKAYVTEMENRQAIKQ
jgi:hypothetical protein